MSYPEKLAKAFEGLNFESTPNPNVPYPLTDLGQKNIREFEKLSDKQKAAILALFSEIFADVIQPLAIEKYGCADSPAAASVIRDTFQIRPIMEKLGLDKQLRQEFRAFGLTEGQVKAIEESLISDLSAWFIQLAAGLVSRWRLIPRAAVQETVRALTEMYLEASRADQS